MTSDLQKFPGSFTLFFFFFSWVCDSFTDPLRTRADRADGIPLVPRLGCAEQPTPSQQVHELWTTKTA